MTGLVDASEVRPIEREKEIKVATERLDDLIQGRKVPDCVIFYSGVPTIGKSTILRQIHNYGKGKRLTMAWIDFDRAVLREHHKDDWYDGDAGRIRVIERLLRDLSESGNLALDGVTVDGLKPEQADIAAECLLKFARDVYRSSQRQPFVLLFDMIEDSDLDTFIWLQEQVLEALVREFPVLIVMVSHTAPNTLGRDLSYPLERRTVKIALKPFNEHQTERQIGVIGAQVLRGIGGELQRFTNGLPGLNDAAVRRMVQEKQMHPDADLRRYLVVERLFEKRLARVGHDQELQRQLLAVAPLRQFDARLLRAIASALFDAKKYRFPGIAPIRELLQKLQKTRLIEPHPDGYGYVIPQHIRRVLDDYLRQIDQREHFDIHLIAARYFKQQVENNDCVAITNRLYHLCGLQRDLDFAPKSIRSQLIARLEPDLQSGPADFERISGELQDALYQLSQSLQGDRTFDLVTKILRVLEQSEFKEVMEPETADRLIALCAGYL